MFSALFLLACDGGYGVSPPEPPTDPGSVVLRRLTEAQYASSVRALIGDDVVLSNIEPDTSLHGFLSVGAAVTTLSSLGVDQYENNALDLAAVAVDAEHRSSWVKCTPAATVDDACARTALAQLARLAWRRTPTDVELDTLVGLASDAADTLQNFDEGLSYGVAAILQSPHFLYRVEIGEPDPNGGRRYTSLELASRLSFLLWNTGPDDALLVDAESGRLLKAEAKAAIVDEMLLDPRALDGIANLFTELYTLYTLDDLSKDPFVFVAMSEDLGPSAREETLRFLQWMTLQEGSDWRDVMTSRTTFVDRKMASLYAVPSPVHEGFGQVELPADGGRRGLLGHASLLAQFSHPTSSSATLRGKFVRSTLLCMPIPPPPAGVDTSIPEPSADLPTLRDRVAEHLTDPFCAGCHELMDPIGLGLENFDGLGVWRNKDGEATIDASGDLDGTQFHDAYDLAGAIRAHPDFGTCIVQQLVTYGLGRTVTQSEVDAQLWLTENFIASGYSFKALLRDFATSDLFSQAAEVTQ